MRAIYETPPQTGLFVAGNSQKVFPIEIPSRTRLFKVNVIQTSPTPASFKVDLFNHKVLDATVLPDEELWRVGEQLTAEAVGYLSHAFPDYDVFFYSQDPDVRQGVKSRTLWVRIINLGSIENEYTLLVGTEDISD